MKSRKAKAKILVAGILAGVAIGIATGILIAPQKGSKLRKKIIDTGEGYADDVKGKFDDLVSALTKIYQSTLQKTENIVADGKSKLEDVKSVAA